MVFFGVSQDKIDQAVFILYGTGGCHLCVEAKEIVMGLLGSNDSWCEVDITDNPVWLDRFGAKIPVVAHRPSGDCLDWPFDREGFQRWYKSIVG